MKKELLRKERFSQVVVKWLIVPIGNISKAICYVCKQMPVEKLIDYVKCEIVRVEATAKVHTK